VSENNLMGPRNVEQTFMRCRSGQVRWGTRTKTTHRSGPGSRHSRIFMRCRSGQVRWGTKMSQEALRLPCVLEAGRYLRPQTKGSPADSAGRDFRLHLPRIALHRRPCSIRSSRPRRTARFIGRVLASHFEGRIDSDPASNSRLLFPMRFYRSVARSRAKHVTRTAVGLTGYFVLATARRC
jgi:hypothetical protein